MAENVTPQSFSEAVLLQLGIKPTKANVAMMVSWVNAEGGHWHNSAQHNPLNTTLSLPGAGNTGSQGNIKVYKSWEQGVTATVKTLSAGSYSGIRSALAGSNQAQFESAVNGSPWGTHFPGGGAAGKGLKLGPVINPSEHPTGINLDPIEGAKQGVEGAEAAVQGVESAASGVGEVIAVITDPNTWLRVAEGVGGMVLLAMGLKTLTRGSGGGAVAEAGRQARSGHQVVKRAAQAAGSGGVAAAAAGRRSGHQVKRAAQVVL